MATSFHSKHYVFTPDETDGQFYVPSLEYAPGRVFSCDDSGFNFPCEQFEYRDTIVLAAIGENTHQILYEGFDILQHALVELESDPYDRRYANAHAVLAQRLPDYNNAIAITIFWR